MKSMYALKSVYSMPPPLWFTSYQTQTGQCTVYTDYTGSIPVWLVIPAAFSSVTFLLVKCDTSFSLYYPHKSAGLYWARLVDCWTHGHLRWFSYLRLSRLRNPLILVGLGIVFIWVKTLRVVVQRMEHSPFLGSCPVPNALGFAQICDMAQVLVVT